MEKLMRGYVFRLYPTDKQKELIEKSFGCSRYIYNYFLGKNKGYINVYGSIKELYKIEPYYPSSQICSRCGYQERKMKDLSIREWECPNCISKNNRDINASINIMFEGIKIYMKKVLNGTEVNLKF